MTEPSPPQPVSWPAEHRAALSIVVHVGAPLAASAPLSLDIGINYTADGLTRLLAMFDDLDIAVTTAWSAAALSTYPQLARKAQDGGHELALSVVDPGAAIDDPIDLASRISDLPMVGLLATLPQAGTVTGTSHGARSGAAAPKWSIDGSGGDVPRLQAVADVSTSAAVTTVILPVSPYWIDRHWWQPDNPSPPSLLLESWSAGLASVRTFGGLMTIVLHPHISGRPGHAETIVRFVDEAIASADVWLARADQVAAWWAELTGPDRS